MFNRNQVAAFRDVAMAGGFSKAAERLGVTQPALSKAVADLEAALGLQLFDRIARGVRLTAAGHQLMHYAREIDLLEAEAVQAMDELRGLKRGRLAIGSSLTIGSYILPPVLGAFHEANRQIELTVDIANTQEIEHKLIEGLVDIGLTEGLVESDLLTSVVFDHDELVLIASKDHPLVRHQPVDMKQVVEEPLFFREVGSGTRAVIEHTLAERGISLRPAMSLGSTETIKAVVMRGMGLGIVSHLSVVTEVNAGLLCVLTVEGLKIRRELHLQTMKGRNLSPSASGFVRLLMRADKAKAPFELGL